MTEKTQGEKAKAGEPNYWTARKLLKQAHNLLWRAIEAAPKEDVLLHHIIMWAETDARAAHERADIMYKHERKKQI